MKRRRALQPAVRAALRQVDERARRAGAEAKAGEAPPARLVVFGPPRLEVAGRPLAASAWQTQRAFQVLVFLALHPRGANRDELLEHFWPGRLLAAGKRNFHPTLSYVRRTLPRAGVLPLLRDGEVYRLHPDYPLTCDAWEFQSALDAARRAPDDAERRLALERAVALAERPPFEGLYASWADEPQRRLRERMESALVDLGRLQREAGDLERALLNLRRAAELDDLRESTRVSIIECLVALGNRAAAVVEYERLRDRLRSELGVDLMPETEEAVRRAMAGPSKQAQPTTRQ
jgi:DNA-binding SARP family transcriptional activator